MNFLGIDTSGDYLSLVVRKGERRVVRLLPDCARSHSVRLMDEIDSLLKEAGLAVGECDFFAVVVGPGSFTGIRIGISCVKGLCFATGKPALAITSFDTLAYTERNGKLLCTVDAGHSAVYACGYEDGKIVLAPRYLPCAEAEALQAQGYRMLDCTRCNPAEGLFSAIESKAQEACGAEALQALYLRKSSAEENLK